MDIPKLNDSVRALLWTESGLQILDQRRLPNETIYETNTSGQDVANAIRTMRVRGAPAIGIAAAYGTALAARVCYANNPQNWRQDIAKDLAQLAASRPTAVNLDWALAKMRAEFQSIIADPFQPLLQKALEIHRDDIQANQVMGENGAELLRECQGVLTHCNTGSLATGGYGTALGVIRSAFGKNLKSIYASETRPWRQGARLTAWELQQDHIPVTLIVDSAAAYLMHTGTVQWVVLGADRIAANGDVANKIGTYSLAVNARQHGVKFMVVAPTSTIDWKARDAADIPIECRDKSELLEESLYREGGIDVWNPVFDTTPASFIDAIVTEKGVVLNPNETSMAALKA